MTAQDFLCKAPLRVGECFQERSVDNMKMSCFLIVAAGLILLGTPGFAHHGTGVSYDASNPVTLKATVTEFRYANPHPQLYVHVIDEDSNVALCSGEFYPTPP